MLQWSLLVLLVPLLTALLVFGGVVGLAAGAVKVMVAGVVVVIVLAMAFFLLRNV